MQVRQRGRRDGSERVHRRVEGSQLLRELDAFALGAREDRLDDHEAVPAERLGHVRDRREVQDAADRGDGIGQRLGPVAPGLKHLTGPLDRPEHRAGVQFWLLVERDLERGHDAEVAAAAANGPEQVGLVLAVGADEPPVGGDELDGRDAVGRQTAAAREPAHAAAERVAGDADVRRGAVEDDEALLGRRLDDVGPDRARLNVGAATGRVDMDVAHALDLDEDRVLEAGHGSGAVAGALRRDPLSVDVGEVDDRDDVLGRLDERDGERALVNSEVPRPAGGVPAGVAGHDDLAGDAGAERPDVGAARRLGVDAEDGHRGSFRLLAPFVDPPGAGDPGASWRLVVRLPLLS